MNATQWQAITEELIRREYAEEERWLNSHPDYYELMDWHEATGKRTRRTRRERRRGLRGSKH